MQSRVFGALAAVTCSVSVLLAEPVTVAPGRDYWVCTQPAKLVFGSDGLPAIPAGFFGPGSEPFTGEVRLAGNPATPGIPADTIIARTSASQPIEVGQTTTVPVEILAIDLRSIVPIQSQQAMFDVFFELEPGSLSFGMATISRTHPDGGICDYAFHFTPRIRFREVGGSIDLLLPLEGQFFLQTRRTVAFPRFATTPDAPLLPQQGPNFFPIDPLTTDTQTTLGFCASWAPCFDVFSDCDSSGLDDAIDIALGVAADANTNGVPDTCEVAATRVDQDSFPDGGSGWLQRYSNRGELRVRVVDPPPGEVWWLRAAVAGRWIIYNFPIHEQSGTGKSTEHTIPFDLGNVPGDAQVELELFELRLSTVPAPTPLLPVPSGPDVITLPVHEHVIRIGNVAGELPPLPVLPMVGKDFILLEADASPGEISRRREVPGVSENTNECGPGASARSLSALNDLYCLGFGGNISTPQGLLDTLSFEMGYTHPAGVASEQALLNGVRTVLADNGLSDRLAAQLCAADGLNDDGEVFDALQQGCDVVGIITFLNPDGSDRLAHAITVVGATRLSDRIVISFADDSLGGDAQGDGVPDHPGHVKRAVLIPRSDTDPRLKLQGFGDNRWTGFMKTCPSSNAQIDAADKWRTQASGTPAGGLRELMNALANGQPATEQDRMNLLAWSCNFADTLECATRQIQTQCSPTIYYLLSFELLRIARNAKSAVLSYLHSGNPSDLAANDAAVELGETFDGFFEPLLTLLDCDGNDVDDVLEITRNPAIDINHNCIIDQCECIADWTVDGIVNVPDIFAFLSDWFAGHADVNGDGVTTVPDIFAFLSLWFAGCPD